MNGTPDSQAWKAVRQAADDVATMLALGIESSAEGERGGRVGEALRALGACCAAVGERDLGEVADSLAARVEEAASDGPERIHMLGPALTDAIDLIQMQLQGIDLAAPLSEAAASGNPIQFAQDAETLREFVGEAMEHLNAIDAAALVLERDPEDPEAVNSIFRSFHTIKGMAGFLDLTGIRTLAHEVESMLALARSGKLTVTEDLVDALLAASDWLRLAVSGVEAGLNGAEAPPLPDPTPIFAQLAAFSPSQRPSAPAAAKAQPVKTPKPEEPAEPSALSSDDAADAPAAKPAAAAALMRTNVASATVKVDTSKLDYLVDMVGELVISQSMVVNSLELSNAEANGLKRKLALMSRVTSEVQRTAMSLRMVTIGHLFQKMARLVRDLSRRLDKPVRLETSGEDTELDRTLVEQLADPLMHMIRNSMDHGIESPDVRRAAGKSETGRLALRASHVAGQISVEIEDDGAGLNRDKILAKAIERGLIPAGSKLSDHEVFNLIFQPGFSTASAVTDLSGRGVGMDVVKKSIQALRGRVDIQSRPGQGTTFSLKLPLTLAMIDALILRVGTERYIVPLVDVREMLQPRPEHVFTVQGQGEMLLVRGNLLPIVRLHQRLGIAADKTRPEEALMVIIQGERATFGLLVDEFIGKQEVVIKSLGDGMARSPGISAGAILGDGRVGLILDTDAIFRECSGG